MPTFETTTAFERGWDKLTSSQAIRFRTHLKRFVEDLTAMEEGRRAAFRRGLRVKKLKGVDDVFEMSWASDGRATFAMGSPMQEGRFHIVWLDIGGHKILP